MGTPRRRWAVALIGSTAVHIGLLWAAMSALPSKKAVRAATAEAHREVRLLDQSAIPVRLVGPSLRGQLSQPGVASKPTGVRGSTHRRRRALSTPRIASASDPDGVALNTGEPAKVSVDNAASSSDAEPSDDAEVSQGVGGSAPGEDATGLSATGSLTGQRLSELHQRLASAARRCYPSTANRLRQRGTVQLHFCLTPQGSASISQLEGTTGSALLDRAALECVLPRALPAPDMDGCYDVAIRFDDVQ